MNPSLTIARIAGVRVGVNWSWLIVFALVVWTLEAAIFPSADPGLAGSTYLLMALAAAVLYFMSLLAHELGHAAQARREGVEIEGITLWLFGGVARFRGMFPSAGAELRIAVAGPVVSLLLAGAFAGVAAIGHLGTAADGVAAWLGYINLLLLAFNLLPALPLDGGRIFRSLLWLRTRDFGRATRIAADTGRGFGYLLIGLGILLFGVEGAWSGAWFAFVGWFLSSAAAAEKRYALLREALGELRVHDAMVRQPESVEAAWTLAEFMDGVADLHHFTTYPVLADDQVVGLLPFAAVARVPARDWQTTRVRDCMLAGADVPFVDEDEPLLDAAVQLQAGALDRALVIQDHHVVGLLSMTDVGRIVAAHQPRHR